MLISTHFCCFNQDDRAAILAGFKHKIASQEAMTGREFCELLEIDYEKIVNERKHDQPNNVQYFLSELVKIKQIREILKTLLNKQNG